VASESERRKRKEEATTCVKFFPLIQRNQLDPDGEDQREGTVDCSFLGVIERACLLRWRTELRTPTSRVVTPRVSTLIPLSPNLRNIESANRACPGHTQPHVQTSSARLKSQALVPGAFSVFPIGGARPFVKPFGSPSTAACCSSFVVMAEDVEASLALAASPVAVVEEDTGRVGASFLRA
jgi:hypothetical protein